MITRGLLDSPGRQTYIDRAAGARSWSALRRWISSRISAVVSCYGPHCERCGVCETSLGTASTPDVRFEGDFEEDARGPLYVAHPDLGLDGCARDCY